MFDIDPALVTPERREVTAAVPAEATPSELSPIPASPQIPSFRHSSHLTSVICDEKSIARLLEAMLQRAGLTMASAARLYGVNKNSISQYVHGRRTRPSLIWFLKFADICGCKVTIEFPHERLYK